MNAIISFLKTVLITLDGVSEDAQKEFIGSLAGSVASSLQDLDEDVQELIEAFPVDWLDYFVDALKEELAAEEEGTVI